MAATIDIDFEVLILFYQLCKTVFEQQQVLDDKSFIVALGILDTSSPLSWILLCSRDIRLLFVISRFKLKLKMKGVGCEILFRLWFTN